MRIALVLVMLSGCSGCLGDSNTVDPRDAALDAPYYGKFVPIDAQPDAVYVDAECPVILTPCIYVGCTDRSQLTACGEGENPYACLCGQRWCIP